MDRSGQGATGAGSIDWGTAGRLLRERARVTEALGEALEAMAVGSGLSAEAVADRLQEIVGRVLATGPADGQPLRSPMAGGVVRLGGDGRGSCHAGDGCARRGVQGGASAYGPEAQVSSGWRSRPRPTCGRGG